MNWLVDRENGKKCTIVHFAICTNVYLYKPEHLSYNAFYQWQTERLRWRVSALLDQEGEIALVAGNLNRLVWKGACRDGKLLTLAGDIFLFSVLPD